MLDLRFQPMTDRVKRPAGRHYKSRSSFKDDGTGMLDDLDAKRYEPETHR